MRFVGERKALAAAGVAFFTVVYALNGLVGPPELAPMFLGLALVYGAAFFGLVAGWFWARWYGMGIGFSGLAIAALAAFQIGLDPVVLFIAVPHALMVSCLAGRGMASAFDGREEWRAKWRMDENAVNRLGKAVTRAGASLPYLVMAGLAPKGAGLPLVLGIVAVGLGVLGLRALLRNRVWGLLALGGAGAAALALAPSLPGATVLTGSTAILWSGAASLAAGVLLLAAVAPFVRPVLRALRA
jgi:hypothetical protein